MLPQQLRQVILLEGSDRLGLERLERATVDEALGFGQHNILGLDDTSLAKNDRSSNDVFQFPHIARPIIGRKHSRGLRSECANRFSELPCELLEKMLT